MLRFLIQQGADVSTIRPADWMDLRADSLAKRHFLTELGVPFTLHSIHMLIEL